MVHIEATTKDGQPVVADGKLADIGSYHRMIKGTWSQGKDKGAFQLRRD
jgi:orotidine-5'-phosphate decarboxylase